MVKFDLFSKLSLQTLTMTQSPIVKLFSPLSHKLGFHYRFLQYFLNVNIVK